MAYDPFVGSPDGVTLVDLETLVKQCRGCYGRSATEETRGLLSAELIAQLQNQAVVIVISRAYSLILMPLFQRQQAGDHGGHDVFPDNLVCNRPNTAHEKRYTVPASSGGCARGVT